MRKYYNLEIKKIVSVTGLKTVENVSLDKSFFYPAESHGFYEFVYVLDGEIYCEADEKIIPIYKNEFKLILPNVNHRYFSENPAKIFIICFSCKSNVLSVLNKPIYIDEEEKRIINRLISETENSFELPFKERVVLKENAPLGAQQITENIIEELLIRLLRVQSEENDIQGVKNESELQLSIVSDITETLENNIYGRLSLKKLCEKLYYSNTYLNGVFKKHKKTTIMKYYNSLKMKESKKLLECGLSVTEISNKLCFDTTNYFSKTFKSYFGYTPSEYKKLFLS